MRTLSLLFIGHGRVGKAFQDRLDAYRRAGHGLEFSVEAFVRSRGIELANGYVFARDPGDWKCVAALARDLRQAGKDLVVVDVSDADTQALHLELVEGGFTVVTANKRPLVGTYEDFARLIEAIDHRNHRAYWFEATVGAGLPVIHAVRELVETGDRILRIDAILSGTLNFLCEAHARGEPFGESVLAAMRMGLAEPDPREDLACLDVARKAIILARLAGMRIEGSGNLRIQPLLTGDALLVERDAFLTSLPHWERWPFGWPTIGAYEYVVTIKPQEGTVLCRLKPRKPNRPPLVGAENRFAITTERATEPPILIRGPGAGRDVTAGVLFGDLLRSIARL